MKMNIYWQFDRMLLLCASHIQQAVSAGYNHQRLNLATRIAVWNARSFTSKLPYAFITWFLHLSSQSASISLFFTREFNIFFEFFKDTIYALLYISFITLWWWRRRNQVSVDRSGGSTGSSVLCFSWHYSKGCYEASFEVIRYPCNGLTDYAVYKPRLTLWPIVCFQTLFLQLHVNVWNENTKRGFRRFDAAMTL